ncbi:MAG: hypothetical protein D6750_02745 [Bacteroidetes bacterium]|nr:MAG: hypothetical protein D6750_02745 [Bacteroidota bacterium]
MLRRIALIGGALLGAGVLGWWLFSRADFSVEAPEEGLLPGSRMIVLRLHKALSQERASLGEAPFRVEPEVPVAGWALGGPERVFLFLGVPLEAGRSYTVKASPGSGLSGRVKVQVQPLSVQVVPAAYWGPEGAPAFLLRANGPLSGEALPKDFQPRVPGGSVVPARAVSLSSREALWVLQKPTTQAEIPSAKIATWHLRGARVSWSDTLPFEVRETVTERHESGWRIRLRCSHWIEGLPELEKYLRLEGGLPFVLQVRGIDLYLYPTTPLPRTFRLEVLKGFPGTAKALTQAESFLLSPPQERPLSWVRPTVHCLPVGTPLLFRADGTKEVRIEAWRILPQNVRLFFAQVVGRGNSWMTYGEGEWGEFSWEGPYFFWGEELKYYGEPIYARSVSLSALPKSVERGETWYGVAQDLPPGVYWIRLAGQREIATWVVIGEYGLLARLGKGSLTVWALSHKDKAPLKGVSVEVWGPAGQRLATGRTDKNGQATLALPPGAEPLGVWADWEGQPTYLPLQGLHPGRWNFETDGVDLDKVSLLAYLQPGRTLFRPGDTLHIAGFLRTVDLRYPDEPENLALRAELTGPQGQPVWQGRLACDKEGAWTWRYPLPLASPTGSYRFALYREKADSSILLSELNLEVEFFRPERLALSLVPRREGSILRLSVQGDFLYGAPAAGLSGEVSATWKPATPEGPQAQDYLWTVEVPDSARRAWEGRMTLPLQLDKQGSASLSFSPPSGWGYGTLRLSARILDDEGRPNEAQTHTPWLSQPVLVGMRRLPRYLATGQPIPIHLRALSGTPLQPHTAPLSIQVEVWRRDYVQYATENFWGGLRWESRPDEKLILRSRAALEGGEGEFTFFPREGGEYEIRIWAPGQRYPVRQTIEVWSWGGQTALRGDPEGNIEVVPHTLPAKVGQKARFLVKAPFPGRLLLSVERGKVFHAQWLTVSDQAAEVVLPVEENWVPGVYLHAVAFHSAEWGMLPFPTSRGMLYVPVEQEGLRLKPVVRAPQEALPGQEITLTVEGAPPKAQVVLVGVDKGILGLQPHDVGDPYETFYARRAYGLQVYEHFPYVPVWGPSVVGGDLASLPGGDWREARETLVAFFWGPQKADQQGRLQVKARMPAYTGQIRWRAYVLTERAFGMAEATTRLTTPVVARLSLPYFLSEGDQVELTLTLQNTTARGQTGSWEVRFAGKGLSCSPDRGDYVLAPGAAIQQKLRLQATAPVGIVKAELVAGGLLLQAREIRLRPAEAPQSLIQSYTIAPGESLTIQLPGEAFLPPTREMRLIVSPSPLLPQIVTAIRELVGYPHGCGEQITSRALATLLAGEWVVPLTGFSADSLRRYTLAALTKLASLMDREGGFAYWPGGTADPWLSVYVAYFLYEAQKAGYIEAQPLWQKALAYQKAHLPAESPNSLTQAFRALLIAQALPASEARRLFPAQSQVKNIPASAPLIRSLWRAAFAQVGLPLPGAAPTFSLPKDFSYARELSSPHRDVALQLYAESFLSPSEGGIAKADLEKLAVRLLKEAQHLSTQEAAWLLLALKRLAAGRASGLTMQVAGRTYKPSGFLWAMEAQALTGQTLLAYNASQAPLYLVVSARGVPIRPMPAQSHGFALSTWLKDARTGRVVSETALHPGQRIQWVIEIQQTEEAERIENFALTVPLPAGWQADNPRLSTATEELKGLQLTYADRREDRLLYYLTLYQRTARLEIPVQVIHAGEYQLPSISGVVMYRPELFGSTASQKLVVGYKGL